MSVLSVIMPVRNGQETVRDAVRSTLRALPPCSELVVLDDASTDATPEILAGVTDSRLRVISAAEGLGVAAGLNRLLAESRSDFVARMDADDIMMPWRLHRQLATMRKSDVGATFTSVIQWRPGKRRVTPPAPLPISPSAFPFHLMLRNPVAHPAMMSRRSVMNDIGGYRKVPSEDYDLFLRLAVAGVPMSRTLMPGLAYRLHESQVTASTRWRQASWADPSTLASFTELSSRVLGAPFPRLTTHAADLSVSRVEMERTLLEFSAAMRERSRILSGFARYALLRLLDQRLEHAREIRRGSEIAAESAG